MATYFISMLFYDVKITILSCVFIPVAMALAEKLKSIIYIIYTQRLSSMIACDTVAILEDGMIKNAGSPEILLQNDDWYRNHIELEKLTWR